MDLHFFTDIHTHDINAGDTALINLPWGADVPPHGYYSVGIHPWDTSSTTDDDIVRLDELARHERVIAIGETGLDALKGADLQRQEEIFLQHVRLSEALGKPLIIHSVRTLPRIMQLRKQLRPLQRWIIHGYRGNATTARQLLNLGFGISLGQRFNPEVPSVIPPDRLFRESDTV